MKTRVWVVAVGALVASLAPASGPLEFRRVPELERPPGIEVQDARTRGELGGTPEAERGFAALEELAASRWSDLRTTDWAALSRAQVDATAGWVPPRRFEVEARRVLARDGLGRLHLELTGPRLPARYDIVHRHVMVLGRFDPGTGRLDRLAVTIRGWVFE